MAKPDRHPQPAYDDGPIISRELASDQAQIIAHYKKMFERTSEMAKIGVWECDLATSQLTWTDAVYDLFELPRGTPVTRSMALAMYDEQSRRDMLELRDRAIAEGTNFSVDIQITTAKGNCKWVRINGDVEQEEGVSVRVFGTKQDISAERAAQEKLQSLQTELIQLSRKSAMAAMAETLAHELNQPLTAIANYVAGIRRANERGTGTLEVIGRGFEAIEKSALKAGQIIRSLRAMTSGRATRKELLDPNPLIREAGSLAVAGGGHGATVRYDLAEGVRVLVDAVQIQQVVINLIRNAIDAVQGRPRREIHVSTRVEDLRVVLRVEDSGTGIAPALLDSLFESFVTSKPDGSGIGLAISRTIIEAHGGRISALNRGSGGATLRVDLPLANSVQPAELQEEVVTPMRLAS